MAEHTQTPWLSDPDWREGYSWNIHIVDAANPDMRICFMTSDGPAEANAAFIVKAVNNHDALVKALEPFARIADHFDDYELDPGQPQKHSVLANVGLSDLRRAREVLALMLRDGVGSVNK
jgi:hypothetical protein